MAAFQTIFPNLTPEEVILLEKQIDFLYTNNLITLIEEEIISKFQRFKNVVISCFASK